MYEKVEQCPNCDNTDFINDSIIIDHAISKESFALTKCSNCGFLITNPRPAEEEISKYYESEDYQSHNTSRNSLFAILYQTIRNININNKRKLVLEYQNEGNILDFGSGLGHFLASFDERKWQKYGLEPNAKAADFSSESQKVTIYRNLQALKESKKFNAITCWHSIEHVHDLKDTLSTLQSKLKSKGTMFVALPNHKSYDATYYGKNWAGYDVPRHLSHFEPKLATKIFRRYKLSVIATKPLLFDSYYVSYLSEKYKGSKFPLISGMKRGYLSNRSAKANNQYSSLIYILKKK